MFFSYIFNKVIVDFDHTWIVGVPLPVLYTLIILLIYADVVGKDYIVLNHPWFLSFCAAPMGGEFLLSSFPVNMKNSNPLFILFF